MIIIEDIKEGAKFQMDKIVWIIDQVSGSEVSTSMEHGKKGIYRDSLNDVVNFLNENNCKKIS